MRVDLVPGGVVGADGEDGAFARVLGQLGVGAQRDGGVDEVAEDGGGGVGCLEGAFWRTG